MTQGRVVDGGRDLDITFVADTPLPLLVTRSLHVRPDDDIETILSSDSFGIDPSLVGPVFRTSEMRRLVHLVINAVLYAISLPAPWTVVGPERRSLSKRIGQLGGKRIKRDAAPPKLGHTRSGESLFLLPGKITISRLRELQACERGAGAEVFSRFMVRGHWRRPQEGSPTGNENARGAGARGSHRGRTDRLPDRLGRPLGRRARRA